MAIGGSDRAALMHAVDHILFVRKNVKYIINPNEIGECKWVSQQELKDLIANREQTGALITPWFHMIVNALLYKYWDQLDAVIAGTVPSAEEQRAIHRLSL